MTKEDKAGKAGNEDGFTPSEEFQALYDGLEEGQRSLIDQHVSGLKNALTSERDATKRLDTQLGKLRGELEGNTEALKQLDTLQGSLQSSKTKASFYEAASQAGVSNLRLAWLAAQEDGLIDDKGEVDFEKMETNYGPLFGEGASGADGHAGAGSSRKAGKGSKSMDELIRAKAR